MLRYATMSKAISPTSTVTRSWRCTARTSRTLEGATGRGAARRSVVRARGPGARPAVQRAAVDAQRAAETRGSRPSSKPSARIMRWRTVISRRRVASPEIAARARVDAVRRRASSPSPARVGGAARRARRRGTRKPDDVSRTSMQTLQKVVEQGRRRGKPPLPELRPRRDRSVRDHARRGDGDGRPFAPAAPGSAACAGGASPSMS